MRPLAIRSVRSSADVYAVYTAVPFASTRRDATTLAPAVAVSFGCLKPRAFASRCASFCFVTELQSRSRALRWQRSKDKSAVTRHLSLPSHLVASHLISSYLISSSITSRSSKGSNCAQLRIAARIASEHQLAAARQLRCDALRWVQQRGGTASYRIATGIRIRIQ